METELAKVSPGKNGPRFCCQRTQETEQGRLMEKLYEHGGHTVPQKWGQSQKRPPR